jgi:hypothetical protein
MVTSLCVMNRVCYCGTADGVQERNRQHQKSGSSLRHFSASAEERRSGWLSSSGKRSGIRRSAGSRCSECTGNDDAQADLMENRPWHTAAMLLKRSSFEDILVRVASNRAMATRH